MGYKKGWEMVRWSVMAAALVATVGCSDQASNDNLRTWPLPAERHNDPEIRAETQLIDDRLAMQAAQGLWNAPVFEKDIEVLERGAKAAVGESRGLEAGEARKPYFGDLHVHTSYSFDAYAFGTLATPADAYRFALGEAVTNPGGFEMQLARPLDFYAVTDHGMFLGLVKAAAETDSEFSEQAFAEEYHDLNAPENNKTGTISVIKRLSTFSSFLNRAVAQIRSGELDREAVLEVVRSAWLDSVETADAFYQPGTFTTFAAYEYTASTFDMGNLHRNVVFQGTDPIPVEPFSRFHSVNPEDLWQWMDNLRAKGIDSLSIPHNSNGSNGQMFKLYDWAGDPMDDAYATQRIRNEPIVEITQIKGTSETHPLLSTRDEWADFEIMPYRIATSALSDLEGSYVRDALRSGLTFAAEGRVNPYQFGFIGSSDTHTVASQNDEKNFSSKLGLLSATPEQRGSIPREGLAGELNYYGMKLLSQFGGITGSRNRIKIAGDVYSGGAAPTYGASGLAAVWAEENTRESLYRAFKRKEVYATSGPRLKIRLFGGYDLDRELLTAADGIAQAYERGVPMGGELSSADAQKNGLAREPAFWVMASADFDSAPLQRLQIVKGWIDESGTHEAVIDVACAGGAEVDSETSRCPDNGARVDISDCAINSETGAAQLSTIWRDPDFDPNQHAFYYARVIENPTCRWSTWEAIRAGVSPRPDLPATLQERAWSSPIHYRPE